MRALGVALSAEARKAASSRVFRTITVLLVVGVAVLSGSMVLAARSGNEQVLAQLGTLAGQEGWALLLGVVTQVTAAGGLLAFGVALSWTIGREFAEGTIVSLFALPVPRSTIAVAKLLVFLGWSVLVSTALVIVVALLGIVLEGGMPGGDVIASLLRLWILGVYCALLAVPAGWAATLGRGLLPGIGVTIAVVVVAQVGVVAGVGGWMPLAAPAIWAMQMAEVIPAQLLLSLLVPAVFGTAVAVAWARLQLDR